ncbi:MAG: glycosyltransferase [Acidobacteria bacterium ACB2]|nr:glycosyltransferase [Acidobacteria bacterium ACB2]
MSRMEGLERITPIVLTFEEEANLGRCLVSLEAFPRVVVVDSGSTDGTAEVARRFRNVSWFVRRWDGFAGQWRFALGETGTGTPFVLALDADMSVPSELAKELAELAEADDADGAVIPFEYRIQGAPLAGSLYPPQLRLLRLSRARAGEKGHAHTLEVEGRVVRTRGRLVHDDRKGLEAFARAQLGYSERELPLLFDPETGRRLRSRLRRGFAFTPQIVWLLAWLMAGGPFRGAAARRYALERPRYESMLRWRLEDRLLKGREHARGLDTPVPADVESRRP